MLGEDVPSSLWFSLPTPLSQTCQPTGASRKCPDPVNLCAPATRLQVHAYG